MPAFGGYMSDKKKRQITPSVGEGVFGGLANQIKLIIRLMADSRVSPWLKVLPVGALVYLVLPDLAPGPIDDAAAIWLGSYLFIELCPPDIVQEHRLALKLKIHDAPQDEIKNEDIVDAEYWEEKK
jgi:hypothetical protein